MIRGDDSLEYNLSQKGKQLKLYMMLPQISQAARDDFLPNQLSYTETE